MRRIFGFFGLAAIIAAVGGPRPAEAAAFLWISAPTWSYSAAEAASPAGTAYFWGLSIGAGSFSYAYAYSSSGPNAASALAYAVAGGGGIGAAVAVGSADPWANLGIDITPLPDLSQPQASNPGSGDFTQGSGYTLDTAGDGNIDGITFTGSQSEFHGVDELSVFVVSDPDAGKNAFCAAVGDAGCTNTNDTGATQGGDFTSLPFISETLIPLDQLNLVDPDLSSGQLNFTELPGSAGKTVILVGEGSAVPEPGSLFSLGAALSLLGLVFAARRISRA